MKMIFKALATAAFFIALGCIGGIEQGNLTMLNGFLMLCGAVFAGFTFANIAGRLS